MGDLQSAGWRRRRRRPNDNDPPEMARRCFMSSSLGALGVLCLIMSKHENLELELFSAGSDVRTCFSLRLLCPSITEAAFVFV